MIEKKKLAKHKIVLYWFNFGNQKKTKKRKCTYSFVLVIIPKSAVDKKIIE